MKFFVALILTALLGYVAPLYSVWWTFALTSFIVALSVPQKPLVALASGFLGVFLLWLVMIIMIDSSNDHLLSGKMAYILPFNGSAVVLILLSAFIGGLVSGFAALAGNFARLRAWNVMEKKVLRRSVP